MCWRVALPTQTSRRGYLGWQRGVLERLLASVLGYYLISGQAVPCRPQWGMAWGRKCTNHSRTMEQTWWTEKTPFHVIQSWSVPRFETCCHDQGAISSPGPTLWSLSLSLLHYKKHLRPPTLTTPQCRHYIYEWMSEVECHFPPPTLCKHRHAGHLWIWHFLTRGTCITKVTYAVTRG